MRDNLIETERNYSAICLEYARDAAADKRNRKYCKLVRLAARRYLSDLKKSKSKSYPYRFDELEANAVCDFAEGCPHVEGAWDSPMIILEPAQIFVLCNVFGWRKKSNGLRRFNTVYWEMGRKNAKSVLSAIIALYTLACEGEPGAQVKCAATTGDQARIIFDVASKMVRRTPDMEEALSLETWANSIICNANQGTIKPIHARASTQDGLNPHCTIIDELHAHRTRDLFDVLRSARGARRNPLSWYITTAGYDTASVCYEERSLVIKILEGIIEADHYFGIIYTLDEKDNPLDPAVWIKANPLLGVSIQEEELSQYAAEARDSPEKMYEFRTKRMSSWTTARGGWLNMEQWKKCAAVPDYHELAAIKCYGGLDLAATSDLCAFVLAWRHNGITSWLSHFWLPESTLEEKARNSNVPYRLWADQGWITVTPGDIVDYDYIYNQIIELKSKYMIGPVAYDPWNAYGLIPRLMADGVDMVEFRQGAKSMHPGMREIEACIKARTLQHGDNPVLTWMASNIVARRDANMNMSPDKKASAAKIDGIVAAIMATALIVRLEEPADPKPVIRLPENYSVSLA